MYKMYNLHTSVFYKAQAFSGNIQLARIFGVLTGMANTANSASVFINHKKRVKKYPFGVLANT